MAVTTNDRGGGDHDRLGLSYTVRATRAGDGGQARQTGPITETKRALKLRRKIHVLAPFLYDHRPALRCLARDRRRRAARCKPRAAATASHSGHPDQWHWYRLRSP